MLCSRDQPREVRERGLPVAVDVLVTAVAVGVGRRSRPDDRRDVGPQTGSRPRRRDRRSAFARGRARRRASRGRSGSRPGRTRGRRWSRGRRARFRRELPGDQVDLVPVRLLEAPRGERHVPERPRRVGPDVDRRGRAGAFPGTVSVTRRPSEPGPAATTRVTALARESPADVPVPATTRLASGSDSGVRKHLPGNVRSPPSSRASRPTHRGASQGLPTATTHPPEVLGGRHVDSGESARARRPVGGDPDRRVGDDDGSVRHGHSRRPSGRHHPSSNPPPAERPCPKSLFPSASPARSTGMPATPTGPSGAARREM